MIKRKLHFCLLISIGLSLIQLRAGTIEVCHNCTYSSIKDAIQNAEICDTILVLEGHYYERGIIVDRPLVLIGDNWPIIDGQDEGEIITVTSDHVSIEGFQIQNVGNSYIEDRAAIRVKRSDHFTISNNRLVNTFFGVYLEHAHNGVVWNNVVIGDAKDEMSSGNAIHVWYCKNIHVRGNTVLNHRDGIYFEFVDSSIIHENHSEGNLRYGLHFMFSNDDKYFDNAFVDNGAGVAVMFSKKINMWRNRFADNWGASSYGLLLKEIYDAEIYHNIFSQNTIGVYIEGSTRINYENNDFVNNGWAFKISGGCLDNSIRNNNFLSNTFDLSLSSARSNNSFNGNYWSDYSGYDLDRNGIGDVPYRPIKLFSYVIQRSPEAIVLLRSFFIDLVNFTEKVSPVFTPENVMDIRPLMRKVNH